VSAADSLAAERASTQARIAALEAQVAGIVETASASSGDDEHDPEGQTVAYDRAQAQALLAQARADLSEIDAAFERLDAGTYGVCEVCGRPLPGERLEARPAARRCVRHA
jgi:RNA polymerase-binding transcription factor DksA